MYVCIDRTVYFKIKDIPHIETAPMANADFKHYIPQIQ